MLDSSDPGVDASSGGEGEGALVGLAAFQFSTFTPDEVVELVAGELKRHGLGAAELLCLANVLGPPRGGAPGYPSLERAESVGRRLAGLRLSIHGPYAISFTTRDAGRLRQARAHMTICLKLADAVGASHVTFHAGSRRGGAAGVRRRVLERLREVMARREEEGWRAVPALEVAGKVANFGNFEEVCQVAGEAGCLFCWDVAHDFARGGDVTSEEGFLKRLELVERNIDLKKWRLPVHLSGIVAGRRGEVRHTLLDGGSGVPWRLFLSVLREQHFLGKVVIICESKTEERDDLQLRVEEALKIKNFIDSGQVEKTYRPPTPRLTQFFGGGERNHDN